MPGALRARLALLGPGLLFAATSIGASHLVQSTRAGAVYGFALLGAVLVANAIKYPGFRFGPDYTAATGYTLLEGYRRLGKWAIFLFIFISFATMFAATAALALVTAGLLRVVLNLSWPAPHIAVGVLAVTGVVLMAGRYSLLERITKVLVLIMAGSTLIATILVLPHISSEALASFRPAQLDMSIVLFTAALVGWMPSPLDVSIVHSLWMRSRAHHRGARASVDDARFDFNVGYAGSIFFAICFLIMGVGLIYGRGVETPSGAGPFATQFLGLYESSLGAWSLPLIGLAAVAVMYSSVLVASDMYPRSLTVCFARLRKPESADSKVEGEGPLFRALLVLELGVASIIVLQFLDSFTRLIDFATTVSFLVGGIIALLNHRVILRDEVPEAWRPSPAMRRYSQACIALLFGFAAGYLYWILIRA